MKTQKHHHFFFLSKKHSARTISLTINEEGIEVMLAMRRLNKQ